MKLPVLYEKARKAHIAVAMEVYAFQRQDAVFAESSVELKRRAVGFPRAAAASTAESGLRKNPL